MRRWSRARTAGIAWLTPSARTRGSAPSPTLIKVVIGLLLSAIMAAVRRGALVVAVAAAASVVAVVESVRRQFAFS